MISKWELFLVLFFKRFLIALLICPFSVSAMNITALYSANCDRVLGIPLDADASNIYILKVDGQIAKIPRYSVSSLAVYPIDKLPIKTIENNLKHPIDYFKIFTKYNNKIIPYIQGHPVQFHQDKISFISDNGREVVIDRNDIWKIDIKNTPRKMRIQSMSQGRGYHFIHPNRRNCKEQPKDKKKLFSVHPEEYTSNPISIKRRMDRIAVQLDILRNYNKRQKFYAVPQVYKNITSLGYWFSLGERHGTSHNRKGNLTPILSNQYSRSPFGYQHIFLTGSAPLDKLVHANVQSHFYYSFKAEYFKFAFFYDPNNILIQGEKYNWQQNDFEKESSQHFESSILHLGIDFGSLSLGFSAGNLHSGLFVDGRFKNQGGKLNKYHLAYQSHLFDTEIIYGGTTDTGGDYEFWRYNLKLNLWDDYSFSYSLVHYNYQHSDFPGTRGLTNAIFGSYRWGHKYIFKSMLGLEHFGVVDGRGTHVAPYVGISVNLVF